MERTSFFPLLNRKSRIIIGLMSGTSVDGIDAAVVQIEGEGLNIHPRILAFICEPFEPALRNRILAVCDPLRVSLAEVGSLHMELAEVYAEVALKAAGTAGLSAKDIDAIASHGQTVLHAPKAEAGRRPFTIQLGDGNLIAQRTGIPCVSDFRTADIAAGGQGAPLVPFSEFLIYRSETESVLLQNIGGIANITVLAAGCAAQDVYAFDTGPGNMVIDALTEIITNGALSMDEGGKLALSGTVNDSLLKNLLSHPYFSDPPPKTTGRELFGRDYAADLLNRARNAGLSDADTIATATALTAQSIAYACHDFIIGRISPVTLIAGGGGSHNRALMSMLDCYLEPLGIALKTQEEIGFSSDAKEALAFAILADCTLRGIPSSLPSVTGAAAPAVLGKISLPAGIS